GPFYLKTPRVFVGYTTIFVEQYLRVLVIGPIVFYRSRLAVACDRQRHRAKVRIVARILIFLGGIKKIQPGKSRIYVRNGSGRQLQRIFKPVCRAVPDENDGAATGLVVRDLDVAVTKARAVKAIKKYGVLCGWQVRPCTLGPSVLLLI